MELVVEEESPLDPVLGDDGDPTAPAGASVAHDGQGDASKNKKQSNFIKSQYLKNKEFSQADIDSKS